MLACLNRLSAGKTWRSALAKPTRGMRGHRLRQRNAVERVLLRGRWILIRVKPDGSGEPAPKDIQFCVRLFADSAHHVFRITID